MTPFRVEALLLNDLRLESLRISVDYWLDGQFAFLVLLVVRTVRAIAVRRTPQAQGKAVTIQLQALRLLAIASRAPVLEIRVFGKRGESRLQQRVIVIKVQARLRRLELRILMVCVVELVVVVLLLLLLQRRLLVAFGHWILQNWAWSHFISTVHKLIKKSLFKSAVRFLVAFSFFMTLIFMLFSAYLNEIRVR